MQAASNPLYVGSTPITLSKIRPVGVRVTHLALVHPGKDGYSIHSIPCQGRDPRFESRTGRQKKMIQFLIIFLICFKLFLGIMAYVEIQRRKAVSKSHSEIENDDIMSLNEHISIIEMYYKQAERDNPSDPAKEAALRMHQDGLRLTNLNG